MTLDKGTLWPDGDIRILIDGKAEGLTNRSIVSQLTTRRSEKAVERKWNRVRDAILAGESPFVSGEIVDLSVLSAAIDNSPGDSRADHLSTEGMEMVQEGNSLHVDSRSKRIKTLEDLIEQCEIDLDEWIIERHLINKWEVGAKLPNEYGEVEIVTTPLFQVKVWLVKRRPEALEPVVSPVEIVVSRERIKSKPKKIDSLKHALILPDPQVGFHKSLRTGNLVPFHDRAALDVALQIAQNYDFDKTVWLGDLLDLAEFTDKFVRSPNYYWSTQPAAIECKWWMTQFRDADPGGEQYALEGNHDCFDDATEALTRSGWKLFNELTDDDLVASYNTVVDRIEFMRPVKIHSYEYNGPMHLIENRHIDLKITPNHRLWHNRNAGSKWRMQVVSDIVHGNNRAHFRVSGSEKCSDLGEISDDEIRISAWIIADGCIWKSGPDDYIGRAAFYQRESKVHLITEILDRLEWKYRIVKRKRRIKAIMGKILKSSEVQYEIHLHAPDHRKMIELVEGDKHKLPSWMQHLSDRQFDLFLDSYIDADGSRKKDYPETSLMIYGQKQILDELQAACFLHGYRTSMYLYREKHWKLNVTRNKTSAIDGFGKHCRLVYYSGLIWCATTVNDTIVVRRNGKVCITGNSRLMDHMLKHFKEVYGLRSVDQMELPPLMTIPRILALHDIDVQWVKDYPNGEVWINDSLVCEHGAIARAKSGGTVSAMIVDAQVSRIFGHTHRLESASKTIFDKGGGRPIEVWSMGCLCRVDGKVPGVKARQNWQQAVGFVEYLETGEHTIRAIKIASGRAIFRGKIYEARDRLDDLRADTAGTEKAEWNW